MNKTPMTLTLNDVSSKAFKVFQERHLFMFTDDNGYYYLSDNESGECPQSFETIEDAESFLEELATIQEEPDSIKLVYDKGFAEKQFIEHLIKKHKLYNDVFTIFTIERIIDYGRKHFEGKSDLFAVYLHEIIPELEEAESYAYFSNESLTSNGQSFKKAYWDARKIVA